LIGSEATRGFAIQPQDGNLSPGLAGRHPARKSHFPIGDQVGQAGIKLRQRGCFGFSVFRESG
jgi:hypothetical protein